MGAASEVIAEATLQEGAAAEERKRTAEAMGSEAKAGSTAVQAGLGNLLEAGGGGGGPTHGLASIRAITALVAGVDPTLGDVVHPVLCLEVCGASDPARAESSRPPMDVVLVIDTSGSMGSVIPQVRETCAQVFSELRADDHISLVGFATSAKVLLPLSTKASVTDFTGLCESIHAGGGTNMEAGLREGIGQLAGNPADRSCNSALVLVLSDGAPNGGVTDKTALCGVARTAAMQAQCSVTLHALGFTSHHRVDLMSELPQASTGPQGSYYYLGTQADIAAAVGDCLGAGAALRPCRSLSVSLQVGEQPSSPCQWFGPASAQADLQAPLLGLQPIEDLRIPSLAEEERQVAILVAPPGSDGGLLSLSWLSDTGPEVFEVSLAWDNGTICAEGEDSTKNFAAVALPSDVPPTARLPELLVAAHVLRLHVAAALAALAASPDVGDRYEALHSCVLQCLSALQGLPEQATKDIEAESVFLEGMLQALERDLGEALSSRNHDSERRGVLLSFASEHFAMRSASSLTRVRTAYSTRTQIETRLRFLQGAAVTAKADAGVEEAGLSAEEVDCRHELESQVCYVTLANWRESVLGLGLFVHPRTCRERRAGIPPEVDLVVDYVSAEAYNLGVRTTVQHVANEGPVEDSDDEEVPSSGERQEVLQSSSRRRINAWLPLHINAANWAVAKTFAPSAFSLIATQLNAVFQPQDALKVCARLMCCVVVGFVRSDEEWQRAGASERAVQMYCDVHRLFLKMAEEYPEIRRAALNHVRGFIASPDARTRRGTSDLGILIAYLSILDEFSWHELCEIFVPEMVRRAFGRMKEPFCPEKCRNESELIALFDHLEPEHGRVILFFKVFNSLIARPGAPRNQASTSEEDEADAKPVPVAAVCEMFDKRWGQLPKEHCAAVLREVKRMREMNSVAAVVRELLPFRFTDGDVCELLLWASKHGHTTKAINQPLPLRQMSSSLRSEWRRRRELEEEFQREVDQLLSLHLPPSECLGQILALARRLESRATALVREAAKQPIHHSKEEACAAAAAARERAAARAKRKGKGDVESTLADSLCGLSGQGKGRGGGKGKGKGKGQGDSDDSSAEIEKQMEKFKLENELTVDVSGHGPFDLAVRLSVEITSGEEQQITLASMLYKDDECRLLTGRDLRALIEARTGRDARQMRLVVHGMQKVAEDVDREHPGPAPPCHGKKRTAVISNSAVLAAWDLETKGVTLEVQKKQRGGKKPGNGWHAKRSHGRTYPMSIAGAIARDTTFSRVEQYALVVEDGDCLASLAGLCTILGKDAIVMCGAGTKILESEAKARGWGSFPTSVQGAPCLRLGDRRFFMLAEEDAREQRPLTIFTKGRGGSVGPRVEAAAADQPSEDEDSAEEPPRAAGRLGSKGGGKGTKPEAPENWETPATIVPPAEAAEAGVIIVLDGHLLRETASLSKVIWTLSGRARPAPLPVFHLATNIRQVMLETEEQLQLVAAGLSADGRVGSAIDLPGQPILPKDASLLPATVAQNEGGLQETAAAATLPEAAELPAVVRFKLRLPSLGLVTRLRDRFACPISEVLFEAIRPLLERRAR